MERLDPVLQHRSVHLLQQVLVYLDHQVWADAEETSVVGGVMDLAERESVGGDRQPARLPVGNDVGGIERVLVWRIT